MNAFARLAKPYLAAAALALACGAAHAQAWPERPIRLVVPFGAASFPDIVARLVGQKMSEGLGQPVIVDNRAGAGGNIGTEAVTIAKADGYTLLLHTVANAINSSLYRKLSFDPVKELAPVSQIASVSNVLLVSPKLGVSTPKEFLALARKRKPPLTFASGGNGTTSHLAGQLLKSMARIEIDHVPYKNFGQALTDVMAGQPDFVIPNIPPVVAHIESGRFKAIAVTGARRSHLLPGVPTLAESGLAGFDVASWNGIAVPAGTPQPIIARLHAEVVKALKDPAVSKKLIEQGAELVGSTPAEYGAFILAKTAKWAAVVKEAGAQLD